MEYILRPDGSDDALYKNMNKWSYRRWAWEFLRRNNKYILECQIVEEGSPEDKLKVAQKFGLKVFKSYREHYKAGQGRPKFIENAYATWTKIEAQEKLIRFPRKLGDGQVLVRFDLNPALINKKSLASQIRETERRLRRSLSTYMAMKRISPKDPKPQASHFGKYIRLLDAIAAGKTNRECALLIWPSQTKEMIQKELDDFIRNPLSSACEYAEKKYLELALLAGIPNAKQINA